jgi:RNA polymerase sigma-70 factor (ECF subfamily)
MAEEVPNSTPESRGPADLRGEQFVMLMAKHERCINACILALVPNWADAEDIAQETKLLMWRQFESFDQSGDFGAWARTIARNVIRTRHRWQQGKPHFFGQAFLDAVDAEFEKQVDTSDRRHEFLAACLAQLTQSSRDLLKLCYASARSIAATSANLGRSADSVYKQLERIRRALQQCIERKLREEDRIA